MRLNVEKCKVMYLGKSNPKANNYMTDDSEDEINIEETRLERDLGVNVGYDLKWSGHVDRMVGNANRMLGMLKRTFESRDLGLWKDLYVSLVTPHLEYAVQVCNPHLQEDIGKIETVQRRATRNPFGLAKLQYEERLKILSLTLLKDRRLRGYLIEMHKKTSSLESINWVKPLNLRKNVYISGPAANERGNSLNLRRESYSSRIRNSFCSWATVRHNFFVNRVVKTWNSLPNDIVTSPSLNSFKLAIDWQFKKIDCYKLL